MVSERRKYFEKRTEKIPAVARGDTEWSGAAWSLPSQWISGRGGGEQCLWGGQFGKRSALMGSAHLSLCSVVLPAKSEKWKL